MPGGWTSIMASKPRGMLYVGVTAYLAERIDQHRRDKGSAYCRKYGIKMLVLAERHESVDDAIRREKALKAWKRDWKIELIERTNPDWDDLFDQIA
jgi:putative endonuclease